MYDDIHIVIDAPRVDGDDEILTPEALNFVGILHRVFRDAIAERMKDRAHQRRSLLAGELPAFPLTTQHIRAGSWKVSPMPADLGVRRVIITGPASNRKMVINALNSGADGFLADMEDSDTPTWRNIINAQLNLRDAVNRTISLASGGKQYRLNEHTAVLMPRPRGWHLPEKHLMVDGQYASGALTDFGLWLWHNHRELLARGTGSYHFLPKMQSRLEVRLWANIFRFCMNHLGLPEGFFHGTVLIETLPALFQMEEMLYEMRDFAGVLNAARWDLIFSYIKTLGHDPAFILPDRGQVTMDKGFLAAFAKLLVQTCHRRGAYAEGGMCNFIPSRDPAVNETAFGKVQNDKSREALMGFDGCWVAHPGLVRFVRGIFDAAFRGPNQLEVIPEGTVTAEDLLIPHTGTISEQGLRANLRIGLLYLEPWLRGTGCVPIDNLMEDAATAEISRTQVWQWLYHGVRLEDGRHVTKELVRLVFSHELHSIRRTIGTDAYLAGRFREASELLDALIFTRECPDFLTLPAYDRLMELEKTGVV